MGKTFAALEKYRKERTSDNSDRPDRSEKSARNGDSANPVFPTDLFGDHGVSRNEKISKIDRLSPVRLSDQKPYPHEAVPVKSREQPFSANQIDPKLVSILNPRSHEAEQFKILRTQILYPPSGKPPKSIAITSAEPQAGKSLVSSNLAATIAGDIDKSVLLIDCDLRRPKIHKLFGLPQAPGLSDYLTEKYPLSQLLHRTSLERLTILPAGSFSPNPSELISSNRMAALLEEAAGRYPDRFIILDTTPLTITSEIGALSNYVEAILLVAKYRSTSKGDLSDILKKLPLEKIIGCVLNNVDANASANKAYRNYREYYDMENSTGN